MYLIEEAYESCYYDLWQMNVDLDEVLSNRSMKPSRIAMLLFNQPQGAQVWKEVGGWFALSAEEMQLQFLRDEFSATAFAFSGAKGNGPKPSKPPLGRIEQRESDYRREKNLVEKATAYKERLEQSREEVEAALAMWGDDWNKGTSRWDIMRNEANESLAKWDENPQQENDK